MAGPGVPDIKKNLDDFRALPLTEEIKQQILSKTALSIWPAFVEFRKALGPADALALCARYAVELAQARGSGE